MSDDPFELLIRIRQLLVTLQPTGRVIYGTAIWAVLGFGAGLVPSLESYWLWGGCVLALFLLVDFITALFQTTPEVQRVLPGRFAMGIEQMVSITLRNRASMKLASAIQRL